MDMERVIHIGIVDDLPKFGFMDTAGEINPVHIKGFAIDEEEHRMLSVGHAHHFTEHHFLHGLGFTEIIDFP